MAADPCPDPSVAATLDTELAQRYGPALPHPRVAAAVARVRARRALVEARRLYTQTDFAACISLLSITELELGRALGDLDPARQQRSHRVLADVLLWLGICHWASGEPQAAGASFLRSAQLPGSPVPDPRLLPPELVDAYRAAVAAPRQEVSCTLEPPLRTAHLLVDGKGPVVSSPEGTRFTVAAGSHYLVLKVECGDQTRECLALQERIGPDGLRSLRLEAGGPRCAVQVPPARPATRVTCVSGAEARLPTFAAEVTSESGAAGTLVLDLTGGRVALGLHRAGASGFQHQLVSSLRPGEAASQHLARSLALLLGGESPPPVERPALAAAGPPWYRRWWVWAIAGAGVAVIATTAAVAASASSDRVRVVFGP